LLNGILSGGLLDLLYRLPAILVALSFHEWAHAYSAYRLGDPTAYNMGRMTINPLAHLDLVGFLMLVLVRFGWAKPVPVSIRNFKNPRKDEVIVSLAGVATNLALAFVSLGVSIVVTDVAGYHNAALNTILFNFFFINIGLCVFNLLPIPPLDGYRVVAALLMRKVGYKPFEFLERYGFIILIALLVSGVLSGLMSRIVYWLMSLMINFYVAVFGLLGLL